METRIKPCCYTAWTIVGSREQRKGAAVTQLGQQGAQQRTRDRLQLQYLAKRGQQRARKEAAVTQPGQQ